MTRTTLRYVTVGLFVAAIAACSSAGTSHESASDDDLTASESDSPALDEPAATPQAEEDERLLSELGPVEEKRIKLRCCECTSDSGGQCTSFRCGPCEGD